MGMGSAGNVYVGIRGDRKHLKGDFDKAYRTTETFTQKMQRRINSISFKHIALAAAAAATAAAYSIAKITSSFLDAATAAEGFRVRLNTLLGSVKEGGRLFSEMASYAARVPFEYREIMSAATSLAGVMRGGVNEIKRWMPLIGDLAAVTGMTIQETVGQVIRMYSAGAASADMFRERGVLAMMGFKAGVSYSAEETRRMMFAAWDAVDSKFKGVTASLATTWEGTMSMIRDKWFQFRNIVMDAGVFDELKRQLNIVNDEFGKWIELNAEIIAQDMVSVVRGMATAFKAFGIAVKFTIDMIKEFVFYWKAFLDALKFNPVTAYKEAVQAIEDLFNAFRYWKKESSGVFSAQGKINDILEIFTEKTKKASGGVKDLGGELGKTKKKAKEFKGEFAGIVDMLKEAETLAKNVKPEIDYGIEESNKEAEESYRNMLENVQRNFADIFSVIFNNIDRGWSNLVDGMKSLIFRFLSELVSKQIVLRIIAPITASLVGGATSAAASTAGSSLVSAGPGLLSSLAAGGAAATAVGAGAGMTGAAGITASISGTSMAGAGLGATGAMAGMGAGASALAALAVAVPYIAAAAAVAFAIYSIVKGSKGAVYGEVSMADLGFGPEGFDFKGFEAIGDEGLSKGLKEGVDAYVKTMIDSYENVFDRLTKALPTTSDMDLSKLEGIGVLLGNVYESGFEGFSVAEKSDINAEMEIIIGHLKGQFEGLSKDFAEALGSESWEALLELLLKWEAAMTFSSQTIGAAFKAGIMGGDWASFETALNQSIYTQVLDGFISAMMESELFKRALQPFFLSLDKAMIDSMKGGVFDVGTFKTIMDAAFGDFDINQLKEIFGASSEYFIQLAEALGLVGDTAESAAESAAAAAADILRAVNSEIRALDSLIAGISRREAAALAPWSSFRSGLAGYALESSRSDWGAAEFAQRLGELTKSDQQSLSVLQEQFDVLKKIETLTAQEVSQNEVLIASLGGTILRLTGGDLAPVQSASFFGSQYSKLLSGATTQGGAEAFNEFIPDYLDFMASYGGDYATMASRVISDLSGIQSFFQGKTDLATNEMLLQTSMSANDLLTAIIYKADEQIAVIKQSAAMEAAAAQASLNALMAGRYTAAEAVIRQFMGKYGGNPADAPYWSKQLVSGQNLSSLIQNMSLRSATGEMLSFFASNWTGFQHGTDYVPKTMPAIVHQGEMVIPKKKADDIRSGSFGGEITIHNHLSIDGKEIARVTGKQILTNADFKNVFKRAMA